jgi:hypothetical protein
MLCCLLLLYCKQVYAKCSGFYLGHHQANSVKNKCIVWIHILLLLLLLFLLLLHGVRASMKRFVSLQFLNPRQ